MSQVDSLERPTAHKGFCKESATRVCQPVVCQANVLYDTTVENKAVYQEFRAAVANLVASNVQTDETWTDTQPMAHYLHP